MQAEYSKSHPPQGPSFTYCFFITFCLNLGLGIYSQALAQTCFDVFPEVACDSVTVNVLDCSTNIADTATIVYQYEPAQGFVRRTFHTYSQPGNYTIIQAAQIIDPMTGSTRGDTTSRRVNVFPATPPEFEISRLCAANEVAVQILFENDTYDTYTIDWGDGTVPEQVNRGANDIPHIYPVSGNYPIQVTGGYDEIACGGTNTQMVTTLFANALSPPQIGEIRVEGNEFSPVLTFQLLGDENFVYQIIPENSTIPQANFTGEADSLEITVPFAQDTCFSFLVADACGNTEQSEAIYCGINLEVSAENDRNVVSWSPYASTNPNVRNSFIRYVLFRNGQPFRPFDDIDQGEFIDEEVICNESYRYQIVAEFVSANFQFRSISGEQTVVTISQSQPPPVRQLNSTVDSPRTIRLFWNLESEVPVARYFITRNGEEFTSESGTNSALDTDLRLDQTFCYSIMYEDVCGNQSLNVGQTCPVLLSAQSTPEGNVALEWTNYLNSDQQFLGYVVEKLDAEGNIYETSPLQFGLRFVDDQARADRQILRYRVRTVIDPAEDIFSLSNVVEIRQPFRIFFPNAFTPNQDGLNDTFKPTFLFVRTYRMSIYNREGMLLFETQEIEEGWDGTFKGEVAPSGAYIYVVDLKDNTGESFQTQGTFTLIR